MTKKYKGILSDRLKKLRKDAGLTQEELVAILYEYDGCKNCSTQNISNWENNRVLPSQPYINAYCNYFDCTTDYLYGDSDFPNETWEDRRARNLQEEFISDIDAAAELRRIASSFLANWLSLNGYIYVRSIVQNRQLIDQSDPIVLPYAIESNNEYTLIARIYSKDPKSIELEPGPDDPENTIFDGDGKQIGVLNQGPDRPRDDEIMISAKDIHFLPAEMLQYIEMRLKCITSFNRY